MSENIDFSGPYFLDGEIATTDWPMPPPLPLFDGECANDYVKPTLWQRVCAWFKAVDNAAADPFVGTGVDD